MTETAAVGRAAGDTVRAVRALLDDACAVYGGHHPEAAERLRDQRRRLDEPLRVALVGRVKAGKSTLLNALVGERLAPTDAGECTRVITLYRHGAVPRVALHDRAGGSRVLPVRRADGMLRLDLGGVPPAEVACLVVDWPSPALRPATLVDTPGIASLSPDTSGRAQAFLAADAQVPGADAVVFLTRQLQPEDLAFLAAFQEATGTTGLHTTTITVLSRADEVGSGRLDALLSAQKLAQRMVADPAVRSVCQTVVPVSGLLALAGRLLRQRDFVALRSLALAGQADVDGMLLTADRFLHDRTSVPLSRDVRASLLERFGIFGIRLSVALIRTGVRDAPALAEQLVARSGLAELQRLLAVHFTRRGAQLKAATAMAVLERLLREAPVPGAERLGGRLEALRLVAHDLVELEVLARSRSAEVFPPGLREEGERLLGADGPDPRTRLGVPAGAPAEQLRAAAVEAVTRWRAEATDPLAVRATVEAAEAVVRSAEVVLEALEGEALEGEALEGEALEGEALPGNPSAVAQPGAGGRREREG